MTKNMTKNMTEKWPEKMTEKNDRNYQKTNVGNVKKQQQQTSPLRWLDIWKTSVHSKRYFFSIWRVPANLLSRNARAPRTHTPTNSGSISSSRGSPRPTHSSTWIHPARSPQCHTAPASRRQIPPGPCTRNSLPEPGIPCYKHPSDSTSSHPRTARHSCTHSGTLRRPLPGPWPRDTYRPWFRRSAWSWRFVAQYSTKTRHLPGTHSIFAR